jgi:hypothetical protein
MSRLIGIAKITFRPSAYSGSSGSALRAAVGGDNRRNPPWRLADAAAG